MLPKKSRCSQTLTVWEHRQNSLERRSFRDVLPLRLERLFHRCATLGKGPLEVCFHLNGNAALRPGNALLKMCSPKTRAIPVQLWKRSIRDFAPLEKDMFPCSLELLSYRHAPQYREIPSAAYRCRLINVHPLWVKRLLKLQKHCLHHADATKSRKRHRLWCLGCIKAASYMPEMVSEGRPIKWLILWSFDLSSNCNIYPSLHTKVH